MDNNILHTEVSRREFLAGVGGLTFSIALGGSLGSLASPAQAADAAVKLNAWVSIGTDGVVTVAPAIANAVFRLTGKRLRSLPMSPARVKKVFV